MIDKQCTSRWDHSPHDWSEGGRYHCTGSVPRVYQTIADTDGRYTAAARTVVDALGEDVMSSRLSDFIRAEVLRRGQERQRELVRRREAVVRHMMELVPDYKGGTTAGLPVLDLEMWEALLADYRAVPRGAGGDAK